MSEMDIFQNNLNEQKTLKVYCKINKMLKLAIHLFMVLPTLKCFYKCSLIDLFVPKEQVIKLPDQSEHFSTTKYKPMYLIRTQSFKMLTFVFLLHHWGCLI